jgi:dihydrofolate reductase/thymidylate synthase
VRRCIVYIMAELAVIVAVARESLGIGYKGQIPWSLPSDLKRFREITTAPTIDGGINAVIMGRKTWESLPVRYRPLSNRLNIILTSDSSKSLDATNNLVATAGCLDEALLRASECDRIFVIGGASVYREALHHPRCTRVYTTMIDGEYTCDTYFPDILESLGFVQSDSSTQLIERHVSYQYVEYSRIG